MQEMMRNQDRALSNIEGMPGGFNQLASLFGQMNEPQMPDPSTDDANRLMAERLGVSPIKSEGMNTQALPNPWVTPSAQANQFPRPAMSSRNNNSLSNLMNQMTIPPFKKKDSQGQGVVETSNVDSLFDQLPRAKTSHGNNLAHNIEFGLGRQPGNNDAGVNQNMDFGLRLLQHMNERNLNNESNRNNNVSSVFPFPNQYQTGSSSTTTMKSASLSNDIDLRFSDQLIVLHDMGFNNDELNKRALLASVKSFFIIGR